MKEHSSWIFNISLSGYGFVERDLTLNYKYNLKKWDSWWEEKSLPVWTAGSAWDIKELVWVTGPRPCFTER